MTLAKALRVERGDMVSFVGGGGKTTSMFRLAAELSSAGLRVVTTTTTHISTEQVLLSPAHVALGEVHHLSGLLDQYGQCLIVGPPDGKGRVCGASSEFIAALGARLGIDIVLVEADGSRSLPFKAPGRNEPVVPEATTILAPIAGMNSIGQPLDEAHVHRSEIAAALAQQEPGSPITPQTLARVLAHPDGGGKRRPVKARLTPILNKSDSPDAQLQAGKAAEIMLQNAAIDTVVISSLKQSPPVLKAWTHTAGIVLAAGKATRFGSAKQAAPWKGTTLTAHAVQTAIDAGLNPVIVVLGYEAEMTAKFLTSLPVRAVLNPDYEAGQSTSMRKGIDALPSYAGAAVFLLADQPLIDAAIIRTIVDAHRRSFAPACAPVFEGQRGNPVLFDRVLFRELADLRGDAGGRELLEKYRSAVVTVPASRAVLMDIDTLEEYEMQKTAPPPANPD